MSCCKCEKYGWDEPQPVVFHAPRGKQRGYCVFHAPSRQKGIPGDEFQDIVLKTIEEHRSKFQHNDIEILCNLSGTIFPSDILFSTQTVPRHFPGMNFRYCIFKENVNFIHAYFDDTTSFSHSKFLKNANFSSAKFKCNVSFNGTLFCRVYFDATQFKKLAIFEKSHFSDNASFFACEGASDSIIINSVDKSSIQNMYFTSREVNLLDFQQCVFPCFLRPEEALKIFLAEELYRSLKQKAAMKHNYAMVSEFNYKENLMHFHGLLQTKREKLYLSIIENEESNKIGKIFYFILLVIKTPKILFTIDFWYWLLSGFGERDHRALSWLVLLLILPLLLNVILPQIDSFPCSDLINSTLNYIPFTKELPGHSGWLRLGQGLSQLLITIQATIYAFALRNRFRR
jgi:hypothetical protein